MGGFINDYDQVVPKRATIAVVHTPTLFPHIICVSSFNVVEGHKQLSCNSEHLLGS